MKLKKSYNLVVAADGSAASGKTTGAKIISKKYGLKFLSSGNLYRYASYILIKKNPKNREKFLKNEFKNLKIEKLNRINLQTQKISEFTSIIAKEKKNTFNFKRFSNKIFKKI